MFMTARRVVLGHLRVFLALVVVALAWLLVPAGVAAGTRAIIAWDIGVLSLLLMTLHLFLTHDPNQMPALAEAQEDGQWTIFWIILLASIVSFAAVTTELAGLKDLPIHQRTLQVAFVATTLIMSWVLAHVVFAVRYAHEWYDSDEQSQPRRGLEFPGGGSPDYMDFLYFSMVLAMTFQVSDVQITARRLRRLALLHGFVSFLYNTIIIALTVNIAAGLL
jgi:uncharacterized membrane protein